MYNVLSLCDGMAGGLTALKRAGVPVREYYASEIDPYAKQIANKNHPEIHQLGDLTHWRTWRLPPIDLIISGPPCQGFSSCGRKLNWDDPRSLVFLEAIQALRYLKPRYFLFENVASMDAPVQTELNGLLGVKAIELDAALISAQNRNRLYWTNIPYPGDPEDKHLCLADILEDEVDFKYYVALENVVGPRAIKYLLAAIRSTSQKARTLTSTGARCSSGSSSTVVKINRQRRPKHHQNKASTLLVSGKSGGNHSSMDLLLLSDDRVRRLTPVECERLQTLPDNYTKGVSDTQRYKMIGNGWTIAAIEHLLRNLPTQPKRP